MIKLAYNKENRDLVFAIDEIVRHSIGDDAGIVEYYSGVLFDISTNPVTRTNGFEVQVMAFESKWLDVPVNISNINKPKTQEKTATPALTSQEVKPDSGYTGLSKVTISATPLEEATATPTTAGQEIVATGEGKIGLSKVTVSAVTSAIDSNIVSENIKKDVVILGVTGTYEGE